MTSCHFASSRTKPCHPFLFPMVDRTCSSRPRGETVNGIGTTSYPSPSWIRSVDGSYAARSSGIAWVAYEMYDSGANGFPSHPTPSARLKGPGRKGTRSSRRS